MIPYFADLFGNPHSSEHILGWNAARAVDEASAKVAALIGSDADEIIFTSGATEANNLALLGLAYGAVGGKRNRILVSAIEHKSVLAVSRFLHKHFGFKVETIPVNKEGVVSLAALEGLIDDNVLLVSVMFVNNEIGSIAPIEKIYKITSRAGAVFHSDCSQAPGVVSLDNASQYVDLLSLSGHKMYGPKGIGVLFIRRDIQSRIHPIIHGGAQQRHLRSGTVPTPLCVGMGAAAELAHFSTEKASHTLCRHRDRLVQRLGQLPWSIHLNGPNVINRHPGNANIRFEGFSAHDILTVLQPRLAASTGSACTSGVPEPSHVLRAIGLSELEADSSIRFSLGYHTTEQDVDEAVELIREALENLS
jgi:cysteine desulfurase